MNTYFNWFKTFVNILIELLMGFAIIATIYVFTVPFTGITRTVIFIVAVILYALLVYLLKTKIKAFLKKLLDLVSKLDTKKMLVILTLLMIALKVIYTIFFNFDATQDGDISIYMNIADQIVKTGKLQSDAISHLFGSAIHFAVFKFLNIPVSVGMFIVFYIGTIVNFLSFKNIMGKDKSFVAVMLYVLMPSSILLTFCPTHEIFLYMYLSIFIYVLNKLLISESKIRCVIYSVICILSTILAMLVNPSGYIILVILGLVIVLSRIKLNKKLFVVCILVLSILGSNLLTKSLNVNEHTTTMNTYTILIHGSNPESLGEQVDGYPLKQMRMYIYDNDLDFSDSSFEYAAKEVLLNQYVYLISHPLNLLKLLTNKFYILWSGNHYSVEMANVYGGLNGTLYYAMLGLSTMIYLLVLTINVIYRRKENDDVLISNYKLAILGCFGITILSIVTNKYSLYVTLFIYLISFYKIDIDENKYSRYTCR